MEIFLLCWLLTLKTISSLQQKLITYAIYYQNIRNSGSIKQHQKRIKQIKVKLIDSQSVIKIPERKASISQMIYNAGIIHDILLPGITSDIIKDQAISTPGGSGAPSWTMAGCSAVQRRRIIPPLPLISCWTPRPPASTVRRSSRRRGLSLPRASRPAASRCG